MGIFVSLFSSSSNLQQPTLPNVIRYSDIQKADLNAMNDFRNDLRQLGFAVLEMNDNFNQMTMHYREITAEWFNRHTFQHKLQFEAQEKDELFKELGRKPNIGYILTKKKKEYLKFKNSSERNAFPTQEIYDSFKELCNEWQTIGMECMQIVLSEIVSNPKSNSYTFYIPFFIYHTYKLMEDNESLVSDEERESVVKFGTIHSSISQIHYFAKRCEEDEEAKMTDEERWSNRTLEVPLGIHQDTGLMTFILCSDISGLEMLDRKTDEYFHCEKVFKPNLHCFVIAGRKMELFSWKKVIPATWHAVRIPLSTERYSLLYFMEIQKDH